MKYNLRALSAVGFAAAFFCAPQLVLAETVTKGPGNNYDVGPVFPTSQSGARRNYALALVEELLEEGVDETGGGSGDRKPVDFYATIFHRDKDYETQNTPGLDSDTIGGIIGVTLRDAHYFVGASIDYSNEDATFKENAGEQDTDELGLNLYGTYFPLANNNLFVSGVFRYIDRDIDTRRNVQGEFTDMSGSQSTFDSGTAQGSTNGNDFSLLGGAGYSWPVQERTTIVLSGWLAWSEHNTDGYTESGSGDVPVCRDYGSGGVRCQVNDPTGDLRFEGDDYSTLDGILTATLLHSVPITNGRVIPSLSLSYVHEFQDDTRTINARMVDRPDQTVSVRTNEADTDYVRITASVGVEFNQGATIFASYTGMAAHDWRNENLFNIGLKVLF